MTRAYVVSTSAATLIVSYASGTAFQGDCWWRLWDRLLAGGDGAPAASGATLILASADSGSTPKIGA